MLCLIHVYQLQNDTYGDPSLAEFVLLFDHGVLSTEFAFNIFVVFTLHFSHFLTQLAAQIPNILPFFNRRIFG